MVRVPSAGRVFRRRRASIAAAIRRDPRSRVNSPRLRAAELCSVCVMVVKPSRPSGGSARKGRGLKPPRINQVETWPPGRWGNARRSTAPAPQSKPVTLASRLVAQEAPLVAAGLGLRILAAGPARLRLYSCCGRLCEPAPKGLLRRVRGRGHRLIGRPRLPRLPWSTPAPESSTDTADPGDPIDNWAIRSPAIDRGSPQGAALRRRDPSNRHSECPAARSHNNIRSMSALSRSSQPRAA